MFLDTVSGSKIYLTLAEGKATSNSEAAMGIEGDFLRAKLYLQLERAENYKEKVDLWLLGSIQVI